MSETPLQPVDNQATRERRMALRAGAFVALALAMAAIVVMWIGKERRLFDTQVHFRAAFDNVEGLKRDSPVWLGGLEVGRVSAITFAPDLGDKRIEVQLELSRRFAERIRQDSIARLSSRGVLGDKAIDVSLGSPESPPIPVGGFIPVGASGDLQSLMKSAGKVIDDAVAITGGLRQAVNAYADPALAKDVAGSLHSLHGILEEVQQGDGALHALVFDRQTGTEVKGLVRNAQQTTQRIDIAMGHVDEILREVQEGGGLAHSVVYDKKGARALEEVGAAASQIASLVEDAKKSKNGAVNQLVYGDASGMFADLGSSAKNLKQITGTISRGEGTLGGVIQDPTIYEDLKTILGNVKRNRILRSLVRLTINNNEDLDQVGKPQGPSTPTVPAPAR